MPSSRSFSSSRSFHFFHFCSSLALLYAAFFYLRFFELSNRSVVATGFFYLCSINRLLIFTSFYKKRNRPFLKNLFQIKPSLYIDIPFTIIFYNNIFPMKTSLLNLGENPFSSFIVYAGSRTIYTSALITSILPDFNSFLRKLFASKGERY